ncbi:MAG: YggS family pyridoxal phosphate-dependent enzyme [Bacteroides sp.]|nr:YggS family pyridoxal phosphate-dependent enzyme [Bacteroides sp.]
MERPSERIAALRGAIPEGVALLAVSKFHPAGAIEDAYEGGQRLFGESRVQELAVKARELPGDIRWHFIGHLQTNKVRQAVEWASVIESIDSLRLLRAVDAEARKAGKRVDVLLQVHVAREETKFGFLPEEMEAAAVEAAGMEGVRVTGVMGMASNTDDMERVRSDFRKIRGCFDALKAGVMSGREEFAVVSMGMSHDWREAVECGSTLVRIGSDIFGERG